MPRTTLDLKAEFALMFVWGILHKHVTLCGRMQCGCGVGVRVCLAANLHLAFGDNTCISSHMSLIQKCVGETLFAKMRGTCDSAATNCKIASLLYHAVYPFPVCVKRRRVCHNIHYCKHITMPLSATACRLRSGCGLTHRYLPRAVSP
jgi:hypothetical protein